MLKGIDISHYQGEVTFDSFKSAVDFVIIKATEGCPDPGQSVPDYIDAQFLRNQSEARRVGLLRGFYHFGRPDANDPEPEAQEFVSAIGQIQEGEMLVLDMEQATTKNVVDWSKRWLDKVTELTGVKPLIYMSESWVTASDWSTVKNANYGLWIAKYGANDGTVPSTQPNSGAWPSAAMWQYTSKGNIAGINPVDVNQFYGDANAFKAYGRQSDQSTGDSTMAEYKVYDTEESWFRDVYNNIVITFLQSWPTQADADYAWAQHVATGDQVYTVVQKQFADELSNKTLLDQLQTLQDDNSGLTQKYGALNIQFTQLEKDKADSDATIVNLKNTTAQLIQANNDEVNDLKDQIGKLTSENAALEAQVAQSGQTPVVALTAGQLFNLFIKKLFGK